MKEIVKLTILEFEDFERDGDEYIGKVLYFKAEPPYTAHEMACKYISSSTVKPYLTSMNQVYPKFKVEIIEFNKDMEL